MALPQEKNVWSGHEAFQFLKHCQPYTKDLDVVILTAPDEIEEGNRVASLLQKIWMKSIAEDSTLLSDEISEELDAAEDEEGIDEVDGSNISTHNPEAEPITTDLCVKCTTNLKIAVLDGSYLFVDRFLEHLKKVLMMRNIYLVFVISNGFLANPHLCIRSYYLKNAIACFLSDHILLILPSPLNQPNYLFEHLQNIPLYETDRWGRSSESTSLFAEDQIKWALLKFIGIKIYQRGKLCRRIKPFH